MFLESCIKNNVRNILLDDITFAHCPSQQGGIIDGDEELVMKRLRMTIQHLSVTYPDPVKASEDLNSFAKLNESRLYKLLKTCMDPQTDLKTLIRSTVRSQFSCHGIHILTRPDFF